jgi:hypothetical protein
VTEGELQATSMPSASAVSLAGQADRNTNGDDCLRAICISMSSAEISPLGDIFDVYRDAALFTRQRPQQPPTTDEADGPARRN